MKKSGRPIAEKLPRQRQRLDSKVNNLLGRTGYDRDHLYVAESKRSFSGDLVRMEWNRTAGAIQVVADKTGRLPRKASYTSPVIRCHFAATEFLPSWNISIRDDSSQGYRVLLRVSKKKGRLSPWFFLGEGGASGGSVPVKTEVRGWGKTLIDYLALDVPAGEFQYRVEFAVDAAMSEVPPPRLYRFFVHYSGQGKTKRENERLKETGKSLVRVKVPYRSQLDVDVDALRHHICCPTCVAMVLEHHGVNEPTLSICEAAYDKRHDMYGIWPQASQVAWQYGCRSWVDRFRSMADVRQRLDTNLPIIASIRVGEGELRGARYPRSNGHLIVITGMKKNKVLVNDPYSAGPGGGEIEYESDDIEKVWLDRGGVAILIEGKK